MKKILIIDDSSLSRKILKRMIGEENFVFVEAGDGESALIVFEEEHPDLVLLDLNMSGMSGLEVLRKIRNLDPQAKIIIGSADIQQATIDELMEAGAIAYITKPFKQEQLIETIRRFI
ncbi:MAG: response regulator [Bacteroidales bacterium]|jgi:CheY-like chemotaxis protein|nr:response regulator [Bacteroidales bacterium]NPV36799.1 response regulator [Bacteroidales bacterium]